MQETQVMIMTWILIILTHVCIIFGMLAIIYFVQLMIRKETNTLEKVIRTAAAMTGFLIYFGARAIGVTIPDIMMDAITASNPITFGFFAILMPTASGLLVTWYTIKCIKRNEDTASRIVIMLTTFILVMFADVYAATYINDIETAHMKKSLVPNLIFTISMSLYVIFKYKHKS